MILPARFHASGLIHDSEPALHISMEVAVDEHGTYHCVDLSMRLADGGPVTWEVLRKVPLRRLVNEAVEAASSHGASGRSRFDVVVHETRSVSPESRTSPRYIQMTEEHLAGVATVYRQALAEGDRPTRAVQRHYGLHARSTASRWIAEARARGLLGPAQPRRASA